MQSHGRYSGVPLDANIDKARKRGMEEIQAQERRQDVCRATPQTVALQTTNGVTDLTNEAIYFGSIAR
jgi:hypothetical protein